MFRSKNKAEESAVDTHVEMLIESAQNVREARIPRLSLKRPVGEPSQVFSEALNDLDEALRRMKR